MEPARHVTSDWYDTLFRIGMWWRIAYGSLRVVLGCVLLRWVGMQFSDVFYQLMRHEIDDGDGRFIQNLNAFLIHHSYTVTYFLAVHFMFWGVIDIVLSVSLLRDKLWAFSVSVYLISVFIAYELYRVAHTHSLILATVIAVDCVLVWIIRVEERRRLNRL